MHLLFQQVTLCGGRCTGDHQGSNHSALAQHICVSITFVSSCGYHTIPRMQVSQEWPNAAPDQFSMAPDSIVVLCMTCTLATFT